MVYQNSSTSSDFGLENEVWKTSSHTSSFSKEKQVYQEIKGLKNRFHEWIEGSILEEMKCFLVLSNQGFMEQRSSRLLTRLIVTQYWMQKKLLKSLVITPETRHTVCRLLSARLNFPFTSKLVLGVFVGIHFFNKYEIFSEDHLLRAIQTLVPDTQLVKGSLYIFQKQETPFKYLYLEVEKKSGKSFSLKERWMLSHSLKEQIKKSIEKLQSSVFMVSNEEEIAKNILVLSQEISSSSDLPQVIIHLEEQTEQNVGFRVILVYPLNPPANSALHKQPVCLEKNLRSHPSGVRYVLDRIQTVRYLRRKYPIEAQVCRLYLAKNLSILRPDAALDFYAARSQICKILAGVIGDFRDYNGGIILKQGETLEQFKALFSRHPPDLIENFFYSLTPIEFQAAIELNTLKVLFELFLEATSQTLKQKSEHFMKCFRRQNTTFCMFRAQDVSIGKLLVETLKEIATFREELIQVRLSEEGSHYVGFAFINGSLDNHKAFSSQLQEVIRSWKSQLKDKKVLRLAMYSNPRALDPRIGEAEDKNTILKMLFEGLTRIDQRGQVALGVAQSVEISRARNSYTFHLRSTCWSNGSPVTAHDFAYAWKTVLSPQFKTPFAYLFYPIQNAQDVKEGRLHPDLLGVHVINEKTLQVKLRNPIPYFLELIALPQFFPVHQEVDLTEPSWPTQEGERYVCNGAFVLKTNHSFRGYELIKNPSYYEAKKIRLDSITIQKVHISEIHEMLLHNQIDWAGFPMGFIKFPLLPRSVGDPIILPNELLHWYIFNTQRFPFNCTKLRQAFSLVINRMRILHHLSPGSWPGFTILPLHQTRASLMEEHRDKGVQLFHEALKELNLTQKTFPHLKILYTEGDTRRTIASTIKEEWEETLGIRCSIEAFEWRSFMEKINDGDFQIGAMDWISLINDPSYTLEIFRKSNPLINFPKWHHPRYESLLDKAFRAIQPQKRLLYYALAEEILLREAPVIPILRTLPQSIKKNHVQMPHNSPMKAWDLKWLTVRNH